MEGASRLLPVMVVRPVQLHSFMAHRARRTHDLARIFLLFFFKRRTRFFLHLALILVAVKGKSQLK